ncbi:DUF1294 domain-containing protein [Candidatus Uhrbacteria bacterium]|nr:DUF1294 domain-containing protein [Candidatus Uhrbacteria bacterium]
MSRFRHDYLPYLLLWLALAAACFGVLWYQWDFPWWVNGLVATNAATFLLYVYDKAVAGSGARRVPEFVLHLTAFLFGWIGAVVAMSLVRHKTRKSGFQFVLYALIALQILAALWYLRSSGFLP